MTTPTKARRSPGKPKAKKRKHAEWRVLAQGPGAKHFEHVEPVVEFDEVVVGAWLHVERMSTRHWWMRVGDVHLGVTVLRNGKVAVTVAEGDLAPAKKAGVGR